MRRVTPGLVVTAAVLAAMSVACGAGGDRGAAPAVTADAARAPIAPPDEPGALDTPDRARWQQPDLIMDKLNIADGSHVADVGAGGGWFTAYLARRVGPNGVVFAEDIQPSMIEALIRRIQDERLVNVRPVLGAPDDPRLPTGLQAVLLIDTYGQLADPIALLKRLASALAPGGRIGIVDFRNDGDGGPGPKQSERIDPGKIEGDARAAGLTRLSEEQFLRYQYMLVFTVSH